MCYRPGQATEQGRNSELSSQAQRPTGTLWGCEGGSPFPSQLLGAYSPKGQACASLLSPSLTPHRVPEDGQEGPLEEDAELREAAGREAMAAFHGRGVLRTHARGQRVKASQSRCSFLLGKSSHAAVHSATCSLPQGASGFALPFSTPLIVLSALPLQRAGAKEKGSPRHHPRGLSCGRSHTCPPEPLSPGDCSDRRTRRMQPP